MEKIWMLHITTLCLITMVAIVGVTAMVIHENNGKGQGYAMNDERPLGSYCTQDSQCANGQCNGEILLPSGKTIPNLRVCT